LKELILKNKLIGIEKHPFRIYLLLFWATIQSIAVIFYYLFFKKNGYLPAPFVYDKSDTFMDFFHTLSWAYQDGRYTDWHSVYPGLNFLFLKIVSVFSEINLNQDGFAIRDSGTYFVIFILISYFLIPLTVIFCKQSRVFTIYEKLLLYLIILTSTPMLFALERGNLIIFIVPILVFLLNAEKKYHSLLISILINIKPYMSLIGLVIVTDARTIFSTFLITATIFFIAGFAIDENFLQFFVNLFSFTQVQSLFSIREILAMPSTIAVFAAILRNTSLPEIFDNFSNDEIAFAIDFVRISAIILGASIIVEAKNDPFPIRVSAIVLVIMNLGIWVGGYTAVLLLPLIPFLQDVKYRAFHMTAILLYCSPLDVIRIYSTDGEVMKSYISGSEVLVSWSLTFGSILRPILSLFIMIMLCYELRKKSRNLLTLENDRIPSGL